MRRGVAFTLRQIRIIQPVEQPILEQEVRLGRDLARTGPTETP